jgi:hypothetical protein
MDNLKEETIWGVLVAVVRIILKWALKTECADVDYI